MGSEVHSKARSLATQTRSGLIRSIGAYLKHGHFYKSKIVLTIINIGLYISP